MLSIRAAKEEKCSKKNESLHDRHFFDSWSFSKNTGKRTDKFEQFVKCH